ncbi:hypothetical protein KVR01_012112 [Diaporthe batatas]|uniref:uncharacterized protein n=1 Tax=Diaporthe batatas TaxID=748121 RepID=UPI001D051FA1|nr:uncharacterized protein KVR01_012112 [Diaporthe batatas]KAG8158351.1 hypothetical protein KVR01_012112 [Diaporthe batatas]
MDPISALSLAANIFAVISFSGEVLKTARQIHASGATEHHTELAVLATGMRGTARRLTVSLRSSQNDVDDTRVKKADRELIQLALECEKLGSHLSSLLDTIGSTESSKWGTIRKTWQTILSKSEIERKEKSLEAMRGQLNLGITVSLRERIDAEADLSRDRFRALDKQTKDIAMNFLQSQHGMNAIMQQQTRNHQEIMARLNGQNHPSDPDGDYYSPRASASRAMMRKLHRVKRVFHSSLWYETMEDREQTILPAYNRTLNWIFKSEGSPRRERLPWDDFNNFLSKDSGTYWVTGKAGSGKSTLMKFANLNPSLDAALQTWAAGRPLVKASFYFYYLGTTMQKSLAGLLRSIVLALIKADQHSANERRKPSKKNGVVSARDDPTIQDLEDSMATIKLGFPERYDFLMSSTENAELFQPTLPELETALENIIKGSPDTCFFLSIDGLDEYDAGTVDMSQLVESMKAICKSRNVKSVLSSRPWPVFEDAFAQCPKLRLHDLTHADIRFYVTDKMRSHPNMQDLLVSSKEESDALIEEVIEASAGVFLWVRLVIQDLLEGLINSDSIPDLQIRLRGLPKDLEELYGVMLRRTPAAYRTQTSRLLQLALSGCKDEWELSPLGLHYALELDEDAVLRAPRKPLTRSEKRIALKTLVRRLQSRCMGFVEVIPFQAKTLGNRFFKPRTASVGPDRYDSGENLKVVRFVHRSATDFLLKPDMWREFVEEWGAAKVSDFDPSTALMASAVHAVKRFRYDTTQESLDTLGRLALYAGRRALLAEESTGLASPRLLLELDRVMKRYYEKFKDKHETQDGILPYALRLSLVNALL